MFGQKGFIFEAAIVLTMKLFIIRICFAMTHYIVHTRVRLSLSGLTWIQLYIHLPLEEVL